MKLIAIFLAALTLPELAHAAPFAAAAVSAAVASYSAGITAAAFAAAFFQRFALSLALGALSKVLMPKPKPPSGLSSTVVAVRQSAASHKYVYGQTRIVDVYAHITTAGQKNKFLYLVLILCRHEVEEIGEVWADDYCIPPDWLDGDGMVTTGRYANRMWIRKHTGSPNQTVDAMLRAELPDWTDDDRLRGIAYLAIKMEYKSSLFPSGEPNFSAVVKGMKVNDPRDGQTRFTTNTVLFALDYLRSDEYGFGAFAEDFNTTNVTTEANICDEIVDTADKDMTVGLNDETELTTAAVDPATDIIALQGERLVFQLGDRVEVTSTDSPADLPAGLSAATDYYVIPYQFKDNPRIRLATSLANALANVYVDITDAGSGSIIIRKNGEPRYHGAIIIDTANELQENLTGFMSGFGGRITNIGGQWRFITAAWRAPTLTFTVDDFRERVLLRTMVPIAERYNVIKGLYVAPFNDFQASDYPEVRSTTYITEDNGIEYPKDLNLPAVTRSDQAQRIATIELLRARQEHSVQLSMSLTALQIQPGDVINVTFDRYGYSAKAFEVVTQTLTMSGEAVPQILVQLTLRETAEGVYTWTLEQASEVDPAPNSTIPDVFNVEAVTSFTYNSRQIETRDADVVYELAAQWQLPQDQFVLEGGMVELQYKLTSATDWSPSFFVDGSLNFTPVTTTSVNIEYDIRARFVNNLGVKGDYWTTLTGVVVGSSATVGATEDWQTFSDTVSSSEDWQTYQDTVSTNEDWEYFS